MIVDGGAGWRGGFLYLTTAVAETNLGQVNVSI